LLATRDIRAAIAGLPDSLRHAKLMAMAGSGRCALVLAMAALWPPVAHAGTPTAADVFANVRQFYATAPQVTVRFQQVTTNPTSRTTVVLEGGFWASNATSYRLDYYSGTTWGITTAIGFDGKTRWELDTTAKHIILNSQSTAVPAALDILTGGTALVQLDVAFDTSGRFGGLGQTVVKLTPKKPTIGVKQLSLVVDTADWHVTESVLDDGNSNIVDITFTKIDLQSPVNGSWFRVSPQRGYRISTLPAPTSKPAPTARPAPTAAKVSNP
jgi:outer membrane lipoprotein-sorting protein